jgi:hypothetical protein
MFHGLHNCSWSRERFMAQDIHVTSKAIADIQENLRDYVIPGLGRLKSSVDTTNVAFPGFGTVGLLLMGRYGDIQNDVRAYADDAVETIESWIEALETIRQNWRDAEDASTVEYQ